MAGSWIGVVHDRGLTDPSCRNNLFRESQEWRFEQHRPAILMPNRGGGFLMGANQGWPNDSSCLEGCRSRMPGYTASDALPEAGPRSWIDARGCFGYPDQS